MTNNILKSTIIILLARFILHLYFNSRMELLIHPRFVTFTVIGALAAAIFGIVYLAVELREIQKNKKKTPKNRKKPAVFTTIAQILLIIVLIYLPYQEIKPLSAATFTQRSNTQNLALISDIDVSSNFLNNTEAYGLGDWVTILNSSPNKEQYIGNKVSVSGFVVNSDNSELFTVARFIVRCCAVDATPVGLNVSTPESFSDNVWIQVNGTIQKEEVNGEDIYLIDAETVEQIDQPAIPYIF